MVLSPPNNKAKKSRKQKAESRKRYICSAKFALMLPNLTTRPTMSKIVRRMLCVRFCSIPSAISVVILVTPLSIARVLVSLSPARVEELDFDKEIIIWGVGFKSMIGKRWADVVGC